MVRKQTQESPSCKTLSCAVSTTRAKTTAHGSTSVTVTHQHVPHLRGSAEESRLNNLPVLRKSTNDFTSVGCQSPGDHDRNLITSIAMSNCEAFHALYMKYRRRVARFIARTSVGNEDIEEIINDTVMIVWQSARKYRHASQVSTWIFGIAYRTALKSLL